MKTGYSRRSRVNYTGSRWVMPSCTVIALLLVRGHCASLVAVAAGIASWWLHSSKVLKFFHCLDSNWSINRMRGVTVANELKRGAQMESLLCHPHTHTHTQCGFGAVSVAWISFTICDIQPQKETTQTQTNILVCTEAQNLQSHQCNSWGRRLQSQQRARASSSGRQFGAGRHRTRLLGENCTTITTTTKQNICICTYVCTANAIEAHTNVDSPDTDRRWCVLAWHLVAYGIGNLHFKVFKSSIVDDLLPRNVGQKLPQSVR